MAIHHLLYACVRCGRAGGIREQGRSERCIRCGVEYSRADGANIRCGDEVRHPSEWLDLITQRRRVQERDAERVLVRFASAQKPYRHIGVYLGHVERFDPPVEGALALTGDALEFVHAGGTERWPVGELTAVQPSSKALQLRLRQGTLVAIEFPDGSPVLWEERVRDAVQQHFHASGRGTITEYQPRIVCG